MARALDFLHGSSTGLVYQTLFFSDHVKFQYPPSALLLLDLLRRMGIGTTFQYNAINAGILIVTGVVFWIFAVQILGPARWFGLRVPVGPLAFLIAVRFYPNNLAFQFGQMQILLGLLFLLACLALLHERGVLAGCLIAAAATVKPQFLLLGVLALWQRDWRFVGGFAAVSATAQICSIWLYGWDSHLDYLNVLGFLSQHGEYHHLNQSVNGIFNRFLYHGPSLDSDPDNPVPNSAFPPYIPAVYLATTLSSLVMLIIPFVIRVRGFDPLSKLLSFCAASVLFTVASPIAWVHHYNVLLPAYVVALKVVLDRTQHRRMWIIPILIAVSFLMTGFPLIPPFGPTVPAINLVQSHVFFGALILVAVLLFMALAQSEQLTRSDGHEASSVEI